VVIFIYRDEYYIERREPDESNTVEYAKWQREVAEAAGKAELIIAKNRNGATGVVQVAFNGALTQFSNLARAKAYEAARAKG
jgi:replicative DNA helicase